MLGRARRASVQGSPPLFKRSRRPGCVFCSVPRALHTVASNAAERLTFEREALRDAAALMEPRVAAATDTPGRSVWGNQAAGRNANPGSQGAQSKGLACQLTRKSERTSTTGDDLCVTWFADQRRLGDEEHHGAHLRLPCGRRKGETAEGKDTQVSGVIKSIPSGDHAERGISLGSACISSSKIPKSCVSLQPGCSKNIP